MSETTEPTYNEMSSGPSRRVPAPDLPYQPPRPASYNPAIALIGCGGIAAYHLAAYRQHGYRVVALCDQSRSAAESRRDEFFPDADVCESAEEVFRRDDVEVVDLATHPDPRLELIPRAIEAGKHVLSQKPFVLDLDAGERLAGLADSRGVTLAINQNGRWSPHWSWCRHAVEAGLLGEVGSVHLRCGWSHEWIGATPFNRLHHVVLFDYAIHWFDAVLTFMPGRTPRRVFAMVNRAPVQDAAPPLLAQCVIEFDRGQASLVFDARTEHGPCDHGTIVGSEGTLSYSGPNLETHGVELVTAEGAASPELTGTWFNEGFAGTMGELLRAVEAGDRPANSPASNLRSLALCFAAVQSAETGNPVEVGSVRRAPDTTCRVQPAT